MNYLADYGINSGITLRRGTAGQKTQLREVFSHNGSTGASSADRVQIREYDQTIGKAGKRLNRYRRIAPALRKLGELDFPAVVVWRGIVLADNFRLLESMDDQTAIDAAVRAPEAKPEARVENPPLSIPVVPVPSPATLSKHFCRTVAALAERSLLQTRGFSFRIPSLELAPSSGYLVSIRGLEWVIPLADERRIPTALIADYLYENPPVENRYFGGWIFQGKLYLDHSEHVQNLPAALEFGFENRQIAVHDCKRKQDLELSKLIPDSVRKSVDGIQPWSIGGTYPIGICIVGGLTIDDQTWRVWNLRTGQTLEEFASASSAHQFAEDCAESLKRGYLAGLTV